MFAFPEVPLYFSIFFQPPFRLGLVCRDKRGYHTIFASKETFVHSSRSFITRPIPITAFDTNSEKNQESICSTKLGRNHTKRPSVFQLWVKGIKYVQMRLSEIYETLMQMITPLTAQWHGTVNGIPSAVVCINRIYARPCYSPVSVFWAVSCLCWRIPYITYEQTTNRPKQTRKQQFNEYHHAIPNTKAFNVKYRCGGLGNSCVRI